MYIGDFRFCFLCLGAALLVIVFESIIGAVISLSGEVFCCLLCVRIADGSCMGCLVSVICSLGWCGVISDGGIGLSIAGPFGFGVFALSVFFFFIFGVFISPGCIVIMVGFGPSNNCVLTEYNCLMPFVSTSVSTIVVSWYFLMS